MSDSQPEGSPQLGPGGCLHVRDDGDVAGVDPEVGENLPHVLSLQVARHPPWDITSYIITTTFVALGNIFTWT